MSRTWLAMTAIAAIGLTLTLAGVANGQVVSLSQFSPGGGIVSCGFDHTTNTVWVYNSFAATLSNYTASGTFIVSIPRPGESANDVDIEIAPEDLTLGATSVPEGSVIFINGETGVAELYALNPTTGAVLGSLTTSFGVSHVVGGAYHTARDTFFLVQDKVPGGVAANRVAEINPITGAVINTWQTTGVYSVNFGDIEVNAATCNLLLVSSDESTIGEFTPEGVLVQEWALPAGVSSLSGIGMDDSTGEAWVSGTGGTVWRLGGLPEDNGADLNDDGIVNVDDLLTLLAAWGACKGQCDADIAPPCGDGIMNVDDLLVLLANWG